MQLTEDQVAVASKTIKDTHFYLSELLNNIKKDDIDADYLTTLLSGIELHMAEVAKATGISTNTLRDIDSRFEQIREANKKIHQLEKQLGERAEINSLGHAIELLENKMRYWWATEGLGHVSELSLKNRCAFVNLSAHLFGSHSSCFSKTPVSDKEQHRLWLHALIDRGFILTNTSEDRHQKAEFVDCDQNRVALGNLFSDRLPSSQIINISNHMNRSGQFIMIDIQIIVRDLSDIHNLATGPEIQS